MGEGSSWALREVNSGSTPRPASGTTRSTRITTVSSSTGTSLGDANQRQRNLHAVWVTASAKRAKARIQNSAKIKVNKVISQMSAALRFREALALILAQMFETAQEAVDENSTASDRRKLNAKFSQLGREARLFSERANPIPYVEADIESLIPGATGIAGKNVKEISGIIALTADGEKVTYLNSQNDIIQRNLANDEEKVMGHSSKAAFHPDASMNGEVITYFTPRVVMRRFRTESEGAELTEAPPEEKITGSTLSQDGSTVIYVTTQHDSREKLIGFDIRSVKTRSMTTGKVDYVEKGEISELHASSDGGYLTYLAKGTEKGFEVVAVDMEAQFSERFEAFRTDNWERSKVIGISDQGEAYFAAAKSGSPNSLSLFRYTIKTLALDKLLDLPSDTVLNSLVLGNGGLSIFFLQGEDGLFLSRVDVPDEKIITLGSPTNSLQITRDDFRVLSADGQTVVHQGKESELLFTRLQRPIIKMQTDATSDFAPVARAVDGVEAALRGIGGFVLSSRVTATDSLLRIQENQAILRDSVKQLNEGLNDLQELYAHLSYRPKSKDGEDMQIKDLSSAEALSTELVEEMLRSPELALTAQSKLEPDIAFTLLNGHD